MKKQAKWILWVLEILFGCAVFALGFDMFLEPNGINDGGLSGLAMVFVRLTGIGSVGLVTLLVNIPLFLIGGSKIGRKFLVGSIFGAVGLSFFFELFAYLPKIETEPLLGALYGGLLCGAGSGIVFVTGSSTGGSDIIVRLVKLKRRNTPIGKLVMLFDLIVVLMTGIAFENLSTILYCGITLYVTSIVLDAVVYSFDYSKVAMIITPKHEEIAAEIMEKLDRGATYLYGEGAYSRKDTKVILTAVKRQQLAELKDIVTEIDPDAFIIVQESHQVLGDGFARHSKTSL